MITNLSIGHYGRLGNQIFQYALLKAVALKNNYEVVLPEENCFNYIESCNFNPVINKNDIYKLDLYDCFNIKERTLPKNEILKEIKYTFNEPFYGFNPEVFKAPDFTNFHGYFQSALFFYENENLIKESLQIKKNIKDVVEKYLYDINKNNKNITTIHIRRGDAIPQNGKYQVFLSKEYFLKLINKFRSENNIFIIISDDIEWCKQNFVGLDILFSEINNDNISQHLLDFCLLSLGNRIIIANSSFSWWAAWLSNSKEIYCPDQWLSGEYAHYDQSSLRHKDWNIVEV